MSVHFQAPVRVSRPQRIMRRAWDIATRAAGLFGGRKAEYISEALKQAWSEETDLAAAVINDIHMHRNATGRTGAPQRRSGYKSRNWYASAAGW